MCACSLGLCHHVCACVHALCASPFNALALCTGAVHCAAPLVQCVRGLRPSLHLAQTLEPFGGGEESSPTPCPLSEPLKGRELTPIPGCCSGHWLSSHLSQPLDPLGGGEESSPTPCPLSEQLEGRELTPIPFYCSGLRPGYRVRQGELTPNARTLKKHPRARQGELTPNAEAQGCCY